MSASSLKMTQLSIPAQITPTIYSDEQMQMIEPQLDELMK